MDHVHAWVAGATADEAQEIAAIDAQLAGIRSRVAILVRDRRRLTTRAGVRAMRAAKKNLADAKIPVDV